MARRRSRQPERQRRDAQSRVRGRRWLRVVVVRTLLVGLVAAVAYGAYLDMRVRSQFEGRRWQLPARIYARPLDLYPGASVSMKAVLRELQAAGYHASRNLARPASYQRRGRSLTLRTRSFRFWDGTEPERTIRIRFDGDSVARLTEKGRDTALARLEPVLVGRIHPGHHEDRILVRLDDVPRALVSALLAVEDRRFFEHRGVSLRGMARALLANIRAGATVQGGSTLTQQLAKSYFLTAERTFWRKLNDIAIALILELRYSKEAILESYLNEVYLGQAGPRAVHGFGLAARHYFGRRLDELNLPEVALLVALVRAPSLYNPRRHPERALERRNLVIDQMAAMGTLTDDQRQRASATPLGVTRRPAASGTQYPGFLDLVRRQLRRDYRDEDLRSEGLRVFTTLDPSVQDAAQEALSATLDAIESGRKPEARGLEGAVVVTDPQSGEVLAVVSARQPGVQGFNRALDARRPVGSLIKPVVYLAALAEPQRFSLATLLDDAPVRLKGARGEPWEPRNYDDILHGQVPLITALARSYNLASVNLGLSVGIEHVTRQLRAMGVEGHVNPYPSLLLGSLDLSPFTVSQVYQSIAGGGFRQPLRAIRDVTDASGRPLERYGLEVAEAADPRAVFLLSRALQETLISGTGRDAGLAVAAGVPLAGKTGTTDDLRDSWFAGYGGDRLAVVWVGRDDNAGTRLTGASGALRVWARLFRTLAPRAVRAAQPAGIEWLAADLELGHIAGPGCGLVGGTLLPFVRGTVQYPADCSATQPGAVYGSAWAQEPGAAGNAAARQRSRMEDAR